MEVFEKDNEDMGGSVEAVDGRGYGHEGVVSLEVERFWAARDNGNGAFDGDMCDCEMIH